jgi:predicted transcriptional regulator
MPKQLIVELDDATAQELEAVAPSRARKRSDFVRQALRTALDAALEQRMAKAYARQPDDAEASFDPEAWEARTARPRTRRR